MIEVLETLSSVDLRIVMWVIPVIFFLHEMEEWNILEWYKSTYSAPPPSTKLSCRIWLFTISILGFMVTAAAYIISNQTVSAVVVLLFVVFSTLNGIQHIYWTFAFKKYAPGVIFSSLGIVAGLIVTAVIYSKNLVNPVCIAIMYAACIPSVIQTIKAKNTLTKSIEALHIFSMKIVDLLER